VPVSTTSDTVRQVKPKFLHLSTKQTACEWAMEWIVCLG
jgi:hypothetical protein